MVKNRIVSSSHSTSFSLLYEGGEPEREVEYYRARAKGGCGLIIVSSTQIDPTSCLHGQRVLFPKKIIPRFKMLSDAIHGHGAKVFAQIIHLGKEMSSTASLMPTLSFSKIPGLTYQEMPHEMELEEIEKLIDLYADYSEAAYLGGLDGVELHGTQGYLIQQSWSS